MKDAIQTGREGRAARVPGAAVATLLIALSAGAAGLEAADRFRVDAYGGLMLMNPRDFNLFGRAEEQYNYILLQERLIGWTNGYFTNDFPKMTKALPAGVRVRYKLNRRFDLSVGIEEGRGGEPRRDVFL
jgi:hypothetical protein